MANVALVTDSTTYIPAELLKGVDIHIVPSVVIWSGEELRDGFDIQPEEFYTRLAAAKEMPTTSQPTPAAFQEKYEELVGKGQKDIISMHVSAKLSGTLASAEAAKSLVPKANIEIIDGMSASMGTGWPLLKVAEAAKAGKSLKECAEIAKRCRDQSGVLLMVDTLEFLHRGGRIGGASRFLGTALNLKPILEVQDGALEPLDRVRTKGKAMARLVEVLEDRVAGRSPVRVAAIHANAPEDVQELLDMANQRVHPIQSTIAAVSPAVGTHTGPGTLGLAYLAGIE
jgi:DegV family protein with EDD domain